MAVRSLSDGAFSSVAQGTGSGLAIRATLIVLLLAAASGAWCIARRRAARFRPQRQSPDTGSSQVRTPTLTHTDLAQDLGTRGTFVQFSSATCATCPQVRRVLAQLAGSQPGVVHVDLRSEDHMDLVRRFSIFRTPTVLLLGPEGLVHSRTSGPLTPARALAALDQLSSITPRSFDV